ncbi:MAG: DedA family protein [Nanoarchaeota archaeon]
MNIFSVLIDFIIHLDDYLGLIIDAYGTVTYLILFIIVFLETGLVITPFLPGDSLIFVAGAFAARGVIDVFLLFFVLSAAAILGDTVNYWIGGYSGSKIENSKFLKREYLNKTKEFYKKHGGKTIIFARFIPIIRTFAPFIAGIGKMDYVRFLAFNVVGGIIWVGLFIFSGFYFGQIEIVQENLTIIIIAIILLSFLPPLIEFFRGKKKE